MSTNDKKVVVRFPPSPTGPLHVGNVRTALFNYFFARQNGGEFIVRIEDTDKARSKKEYEDNMLESLKWLGLSYDNKEIWHQSERTDIYKTYLHRLIDAGKAYISEETEGENKQVVRFKNPNTTVIFEDLIRGTVSIDTAELGDFIIARNINDPVYHIAVVVDDFEQGVTHVIRGEDHISNTPRHILLQEAIGAPRPIYAHLPLILASDRSKLSKRKHGEMVSLDYYKALGYLPQALVNFMSLLGFNPGGEQEIYSLDEFIKIFDFAKVQKGGAVFNTEKLDWFNKEYIKKLPKEIQKKEIVERLKKSNIPNISKLDNDAFAEKILSIILDRISKWSDIDELVGAGELSYFFESPDYPKDMLFWKNENDAEKTKERLSKVMEIFNTADEKDFNNPDDVKKLIWDYAEQEGRGQVLWPLRVALSGKEKSPDPFTLSSTLGKVETISRIQKAIEVL